MQVRPAPLDIEGMLALFTRSVERFKRKCKLARLLHAIDPGPEAADEGEPVVPRYSEVPGQEHCYSRTCWRALAPYLSLLLLASF